ncbi:cytochrome P450 [Cladorrhinum sp. PSN259]|nr:cytochrome P450 [Cladorrhinum sp. PSN259]
MASNTTSFTPSSNGVGEAIVAIASKNIPLTIGIAVVFTFLLNTLLTPRVDPREPPLIKPSIPLIGHIINLFRYHAEFHRVLSRSFKDKYPIATLQMLNGKMYAIWDPTLISSGFKSKHLSTHPMIQKYIQNLMAPSKEGHALLTGPAGEEMTNHMMAHVIPQTMRGAHLEKMTNTALRQLCLSLNSLTSSSSSSSLQGSGPGFQIPNFYLWTRHLLVSATSTALYGKEVNDPFRLNPEMEQALFDFEASLFQLSLGLPFPSLTAKKGHAAREILRRGVEPFYKKKLYDLPEVSEFVRSRAHTLHKDNLPEDDIPRVEIMLPFAAMSNTVPTLFWFLVFVLSSPRETREKLRREILDSLLVSGGPEINNDSSNEVLLKISQILVQEKCPLFYACYRETLRVAIHQVSSRTVTQDVVLTGQNGMEFLLKKDTQVQMSLGYTHKMEGWWGEDADKFRPERWLDSKNAKSAKLAYQPFGGGIHLCPGRYFAFGEMGATIAIFLLGFDVEPLGGTSGGEWKLPAFRVGSLVDAVSKPVNDAKGFGITVKPRKGWENVTWKVEMA